MWSNTIVDDESDLVFLFSEILQTDGYNVCRFNHSLETLNKIGKNSNKYNLIITDYRLPQLNAHLIAKLKKQHPNIKTILTSAFTDVQ
jgi:DNA-binding NtrC family response regulator